MGQNMIVAKEEAEEASSPPLRFGASWEPTPRAGTFRKPVTVGGELHKQITEDKAVYRTKRGHFHNYANLLSVEWTL